MSQLLDSDFEQQPDFKKDLEILRNRIFIMAAVCGLLWLNLRYFFLDEIIIWSKPIPEVDKDFLMLKVFFNTIYLPILLIITLLFITFSIESLKKHFMDNLIVSIIATAMGVVGVWFVLLIVGYLFAAILLGIGFPEIIIPDISFLVITVGCFEWLYYSFRKRLEV